MNEDYFQLMVFVALFFCVMAACLWFYEWLDRRDKRKKQEAEKLYREQTFVRLKSNIAAVKLNREHGANAAPTVVETDDKDASWMNQFAGPKRHIAKFRMDTPSVPRSKLVDTLSMPRGARRPGVQRNDDVQYVYPASWPETGHRAFCEPSHRSNDCHTTDHGSTSSPSSCSGSSPSDSGGSASSCGSASP